MRLSRGRSTPTRRAIDGSSFQGLLRPFGTSRRSGRDASPASQRELRPSVPEVVQACALSDHVVDVFSCEAQRSGSALALLVTRVLADHHDASVATNHLALVTDLLDARVDLHSSALSLLGRLAYL